MLNYVRQYFKIRVVFRTLYRRNGVGAPLPPIFVSFLTQETRYQTAVKCF